MPGQDAMRCFVIRSRVMDSTNGQNGAGKAKKSLEERLQHLQTVLEDKVEWPSVYVFKFIVPASEENHILALLDGMDCKTRTSKTGKYVSVTVEEEMASAGHVIDVYRRTATVRGLISL